MRDFIATLAIVMLSFCLSAGTSHADTIEAKKFIMEHYLHPLPKQIVDLPWVEFKKYIDRYTYILSPEMLKYRENAMRGISTGRIGIRRDSTIMGWQITNVVPGGPAYYAGLRLGDVIYSADDVALMSIAQDSAHRRVTGPAGTGVALEFMREGKCYRTVVHRADITEDQVFCLVQNRTMAVRITQFGADMHAAFMRVTADVSPADIDTVIFDVRDNPGGMVDETVKLLSEFIENEDTIIAEKYRDDVEYRTAEFFGRWRGTQTIIVLQDSNSASASEMFAGTLKVRRNAIIVGTTSYGKGRMQRIYGGPFFRAAIGADSAIAAVCVTIGTYLAGGILPVDSIGVIPDVKFGAPERQSGHLPDSFDVLGLRLAIDYPTKHQVDSVDNLGFGPVAQIIWGDRVEINYAFQDLAAVRPLIPTPVWRCTANHDTLPTAYTKADEEAIRRKLASTFQPHLPDSVLGIEPLERLLQHVAQYARVVGGDELVLERTRKGPTSADLGMKLDTIGKTIYVVDVIPGTPSYDAGVCIGDRVMFINDRPLSNLLGGAYLGILEAVKANKPVRLTIRRGNRQFTVACKPHVRGTSMPLTHIHDEIGYIKTDRFGTSANVTHQIWSAMSRLRDSGVHTLVFDLRGSSGGTSSHVQRMMEHFARPGDTVLNKIRNGVVVERSIINTYGGFVGWDVYILVDRNTADAAETFAYMMQRNRYATIVGTATQGRMEDVDVTRITSSMELRVRTTHAGPTQGTQVHPDIATSFYDIDMQRLCLEAQQITGITAMRSRGLRPTADMLDDLSAKLPAAVRSIDTGSLATIIFGGQGQLFHTAKQIKPLITQHRRYSFRK